MYRMPKYQTPEVTPHCENCGQKYPQTNEGYTTCCNELVCYGETVYTWTVQLKGGREIRKDACCGHELDEMLKREKVQFETYWR